MNAIRVKPNPVFHDRTLRFTKVIHWPQERDVFWPLGLNGREHPIDFRGRLLRLFPRFRGTRRLGRVRKRPLQKSGTIDRTTRVDLLANKQDAMATSDDFLNRSFEG